MKRILLGGVLGGIAMFVWSAAAHMLLPVGEMGIKILPDEKPVLDVLRSSIHESGFYFFPGMDMSRRATEEEQKAWEAKYEAGPTGILICRPHGAKAFAPSQMLTELASDIAAVLLAAFLLSRMAGGFGMRVLSATLLGPIAWLAISASYWNWYGFPGMYVAGEAIDQTVGWLCAGLVVAAIVKAPASKSS